MARAWEGEFDGNALEEPVGSGIFKTVFEVKFQNTGLPGDNETGNVESVFAVNLLTWEANRAQAIRDYAASRGMSAIPTNGIYLSPRKQA
jgi:hypothetical protein